MLNTKTLKQFQEELGSKNPTPGGGVVAALTASFAASLIEMVCNLTLGKEKYQKVQKDIIKIHKRAVEIKKRTTKLAEEDKKAFDKVMTAYRMENNPTSPRLRGARQIAIKKALKYAIEVPMQVRRLAIEIEELAVKVAKIGNKNAYSDVKTAVHLSQAAQKSALENIKINKESLKKL